jgi:hypothetical protein
MILSEHLRLLGRAGQNRTYGKTAYPDMLYNRIRIWNHLTVSVSVWSYMGFSWLYMFTAFIPFIRFRRVCVFAGGFIPSNSSHFCSFWSCFILAPLLAERFLCFPFLWMHRCMFFVIQIILDKVVNSLPFALKKAFYWSFWLEAGLAP